MNGSRFIVPNVTKKNQELLIDHDYMITPWTNAYFLTTFYPMKSKVIMSNAEETLLSIK